MESRSDGRAATRWWSPGWWTGDARWIALLVPALIFAGHALQGAILPQTALALALALSLLLGAALATPSARRGLHRVRNLAWPAGLFAAVVVVVVWSLTPWPPGGPHPVWDFVRIHPAAGTLDKSLTTIELIKLLGLAVAFGLGLLVAGSDERTRLSLNVVLVLGAGLAIWSIADAFAAGLNVRTQRLAGPFLIPNTAATLFGMLVALCLGGLVSRASASRRAQAFERAGPYGGLALLFAACLLATASRGGSLATGAGLVAFAALLVFAGRVRWSRALLAGAAALVAGAVLLAISGDLILDRAFGTTLADTSRRLIFTPHWEAFGAAPVGGYGLGVFDIVNRTLLDTGNIRELWVVRSAHNVFLTWLEHTGVVGALPMFACVGAVIVLSLRGALRRQRMTAILFGLLAADVVIVVHGLSDFALETYSMAAFWAYLLGLQFAASQSAAR